MSDLNTALGATMNGERVAAGLTLDELAAKVGVSPRSMIRYVAGGRAIPVPVLERAGRVLGVAPSELVARAERRRILPDEETP